MAFNKEFDSSNGVKHIYYSVSEDGCELNNLRFSAVTNDGGNWLSVEKNDGNNNNGDLQIRVTENNTPNQRTGLVVPYFIGKTPCTDNAHRINITQSGKDCGTGIVSHRIKANQDITIADACSETPTVNIAIEKVTTYAECEANIVNDGTIPYTLQGVEPICEGSSSFAQTISGVSVTFRQTPCGDPEICGGPEPAVDEYLTTTAKGSGSIFLRIGSGVTTTDLTSISYSRDNGENWTTINNENGTRVSIEVPNLQNGDKVLWKGIGKSLANNDIGTGESTIDHATMFGTNNSNMKYDVGGNIMSLLFGDSFRGQVSLADRPFAFRLLFYSNLQTLLDASELALPATTLSTSCYECMFRDCRNLKNAPAKLPAPVLESWSYSQMFQDCFKLQTSPRVLAHDIGYYSCADMFNGCTGLTTFYGLPETEIIRQLGCCRMFKGCTKLEYVGNIGKGAGSKITLEGCINMFEGCTRLTNPPMLNVSEASESACCMMFAGCTSITIAPVLSATTLESNCYSYMFSGCTSLAAAPVLPATTLADSCYLQMFRDCTSLTTAPDLPATTLEQGCYQSMFRGCTSLTSAPTLPATTLAKKCYQEMFAKCTSLTAAPVLPATTLADSCYLQMFRDCTSLTTAPDLPAATMAKNCYSSMFNGCTSLTATPELPATTLAEYCYSNMFAGCINITTAPALPVTTLANGCYTSMFKNCTSLTTAPVLPATTLATSAYTSMFSGCTSLTAAPELPATTIAHSCYLGMFKGCTNLTTPPATLPATTLFNWCYQEMFRDCTSLAAAPELPAPTLIEKCYMYMFRDCNNLSSIKCLATDISAASCTSNWVNGVAPSGTFTKASSMTGWETGVNGIPSGWGVNSATQ